MSADSSALPDAQGLAARYCKKWSINIARAVAKDVALPAKNGRNCGLSYLQ